MAADHAYCRPRIDNGNAFAIVAGRHPVVEQALSSAGETFVHNDCDLSGSDGGLLSLITGPNMGGKSTYLRQNALIAIMAQMGSFVPAASAISGSSTGCFRASAPPTTSRDGHSTFMVEMVETAAILNRATARSLVVLDEIGRGTATFDGLSIAWATVEALHEINRCRALFATHFHELTRLASVLPRVVNPHHEGQGMEGPMSSSLHEVAQGAADRSYGLQVARLAGLPRAGVAEGPRGAQPPRTAIGRATRRGPPDDLAGLADDLRARLAAVERGESDIKEWRRAVATAEAEYDEAAAVLSTARSEAAGRLDAAMAEELAPLKMERAVFETRLEEAEPGPEGRDAVTFTVATNPGAPAGPLNRIASGGELSRFLLALRVCLRGEDAGVTMIFDEIDRGVGGATADAVGRRLERLAAEGGQVLVVTHSPQVAARGEHHWQVSKRVEDGRTLSRVVPLTGPARVDEIARMLAGDVVTDEARAAAEKLMAG